MSNVFLKRFHLKLKQFFTTLSQVEKIIFFCFCFFGISSLIFLCVNFYIENTKVIPARGGIYTEGVVGSFRFINPIFAPHSDIDRDLTKLVFSGLMKYGENNKIIPDLAQKYEILEGGKIFEFYLRENLIWSNGEPITATDVIFTIEAIQNSAIDSPIRAKWLGVKIEKVSDLKVRFKLKNPSAIFLENTILGIIPKHIWQDILGKNFSLSKYNLKPIGSGPYKVKDIIKDEQDRIESLQLIANPNYHGKQPYIPNLVFSFFNTGIDLVQALRNNKISGFFIPAENITKKQKEEVIDAGFSKYQFLMPRYFAVFFNAEKSKILELDKIRKALNYGTNRQIIISEIMEGQARPVISPVLPEIFGLGTLPRDYFNPKRANELLDQTGFILIDDEKIRKKVIDKIPAFQFTLSTKRGDKGKEIKELQRCLAELPKIYPHGVISGYFGEKTKDAVVRFQEKYRQEILAPQNLTKGTGAVKAGTRAKLNKLCHKPTKVTLPLKLSLATADQSFLVKVAHHLKSQWKELGIKLEIKTLGVAELESKVIRPRNYEMLLFGQSLRIAPDLFPFWHSSQKRDPGFNLALYKNKRVDELLEKIRQTIDKEEQKIDLEEFQKILIKDNPAIFLFNPISFYFVLKDIKGKEVTERIIIDPSKRFSDIENWYIKTKRVWR